MIKTDTFNERGIISESVNQKEIRPENAKKLIIISSGYDAISIRFLSELVCIGRDIFKNNMSLILPSDPSADIYFPGKKITIHTIKDFSAKQKSGMNPLFLLISHLIIEIKTAYLLFKGNKSDIYLFFLCQSKVIPILTLKLQKKKCVLMLGASFSELYRAKKTLGLKIFSLIEKIDFTLADKIIIYSPKLIADWHLESYQDKILIAHEHFLDFNSFTVTTPQPSRPAVIGYIGRLSVEKGVQHFVSALPAILTVHKEYRVLVGGDGPLKESFVTAITANHLNDHVDLPGWISHDELPRYMNQVRLLVLPSYTEGLPNIMLEAMACGTPILATPVGVIPDIIQDGKTGFIMENNSPECIAKNVMRALDCPDLAEIAENGRQFVQNTYSFNETVSDWKKIVDTI
jgi:glycosyltransferase involved in cell wall biosynthesis